MWKSNICIYIHFLIAYNKLIVLGKQLLCCSFTFQTQSLQKCLHSKKPILYLFRASFIELGEEKLSPWCLLPSSSHNSMTKMEASILDCCKKLCQQDKQLQSWLPHWYKQVFLLFLSLLPAAFCTNQIALKNKQWYLFIFLFINPPPSPCTILEIKHFAADCELGKCICSPVLWNTTVLLQCLNRPNYGKSSQVSFVKTEIIDKSLGLDSLISCDPGIKKK